MILLQILENSDLILFSEYSMEKKRISDLIRAIIRLKAPFVSIKYLHRNFTVFNLPLRFYSLNTCLSKNNENEC